MSFEILKERDVTMFCNYVAFMNCERMITIYDGYPDDRPQSFVLNGIVSVDDVRSIVNTTLNYSGFIVLTEFRKDYTLTSGFMTYQGYIVKLKDFQTKNVVKKLIENHHFIESPCSISPFSFIEIDVMEDSNIFEKDLLIQ